MIKIVTKIAITLICALPLVGFDYKASTILAEDSVENRNLADLCNRNALIFFVGNGESAIKDREGKKNFSTSKLINIINDSKQSLVSALERRPVECNELSKTSNPRTLLVLVTDGPSYNDSKIETYWYSNTVKDVAFGGSIKWSRDTSAAFWKIENNKVVVAKKDEKHELHLPTAVEKIARYFAEQKPAHENEFDQSVYLFKSHGAKIRTIQKMDMNTVFKSINSDSVASSYTHAFMFDQYGPDSKEKLVASIFTVDMQIEAACKKFVSLTPNDSGFANKEMCQKCSSFIDFSTSPAFSKCQKPTAKNFAQTTTDFDAVLDINADNTLDPNADNTLDPNADNTLGGKNLVFAPAATVDSSFRQLTQAISYASDAKEIEGMYKMRLPLIGKKDSPSLVLLDSCWGTKDIVENSFERMDRTVPVVAVFNPNPMGISAIDYGALNLIELLSLSAVYSKDPKSGSSLRISSHFATNGLGAAPKAEKSTDERKIEIHTIR